MRFPPGLTKPWILTVLLLTLSLGAAAAADLPQGIERVASVEGITEYRLDNGLRVLLFPDPSKPTITVNITYLVGSRHEQYGETGMAHLLEHLLFKGSTNHPNVPQELTEHGARPNGTTWWDRTNYFETFHGTDENLEWALSLEADRMVNSFIAAKDLESEMTVVRNEFEMGENNPRGVLEERVFSTAFLWHNYGNSTIGSRADIENVPIERLQAFYRTYYQPDNAVLLVAGRVDEAKTLGLVSKHFSSIPKPSRVLQTTYTAEPTQDGERTVTLRRVGDVQAVCAAYHIPSGAHEEAAALDILARVLADTPSGRLHRALVEAQKASSVSGWQYRLCEPGAVIFQAEVRTESSLDEASDLLVQTVEGLGSHPVSEEEVERARVALLKENELAIANSQRLGLEMSEWIAIGDWRLFFLHRDRLEKVTVADVQRTASTYLTPSNRTLGTFIPTAEPIRAEIPNPPSLATMLEGYQGQEAMKAAEEFEPTPENIESRVQRTTLPNGAELALLPKQTRGGTVVASMTFRFGDEKSLSGRVRVAEMAGGMLSRGTSKHTRQEIADTFDRLKARVHINGWAGQAFVSVETVRENLPEVLKLVREVVREPAFPASEFEQLRQEMLARFEEERSEPGSVASVALDQHMHPFPKEDVRYNASPEEKIADTRAIQLEDVKAFYSDFYGGSNGQLAIVGDFDPAQLEGLASELFGDWKSPRPYERVKSLYHDASALNRSLETPDKANAVFSAGLNLKLSDAHSDYPALVLGNFMLGGGFLNSRLATRIRQKDGLSYGVGSSLSAQALDETGSFGVWAICAPENISKVEAAFKEEVGRALEDGFTAEEVAAAKSGLLQRRQMNRAQDGDLARTLTNYLFLDRTLAWDADLEKRIEALSPEEVGEAIARHLEASQISIVKAGDFAKTAAQGGEKSGS